VKAGWGTKKLGEICRIELGGTPPRKSPRFWDVNHETSNVWLSIADLSKLKTKHASSSKEHLSDEGADKVKIVPAGTLMVSFKLTLGKLAYAKIDLRTNEAIAALNDLDVSVISKEFLFWFLSFFDWDEASKGEEKVKGKTLNKAKLKEIDVIIPPLPEQKRIVEVLDAAFAKINRLETITKQNIVNVEEVFDSALNIVMTPEDNGWLEEELGNCFRLKSGDGLTSKAMVSGKFDVYGGNGVAGTHHKSNLSGRHVIVGRVGALCGNARFISFDIWLTDNAFKIIDYKYDFDHEFLTYLLNFKKLRNLARQSAQPVISNSSLKELRLAFPKNIKKQKKIVKKLDVLNVQLNQFNVIYSQKLTALAELRQSLLQKAFAGELVANMPSAEIIPFPIKPKGIESQALRSVFTAKVWQCMTIGANDNAFVGRTMLEKANHMAEAFIGIDMDREPMQGLRGPTDDKARKVMETYAEDNGYFTMQAPKASGRGYKLIRGRSFDQAIAIADKYLEPYKDKFDKLIGIIKNMNTRELEVFTTVYAAWNNLLIDKSNITDDIIIWAARENWHETKTEIDRALFVKAIKILQQNDMVPTGIGKYVKPFGQQGQDRLI